MSLNDEASGASFEISTQTENEKHLIESSVQTDEELIYNYAWTKFYHHFNQHSSNHVSDAITVINNTDEADIQLPDNKAQFHDCKNGIFFDAKNALYFDQAKNLYFDLENKINYHYILNKHTKTYQLRYHSEISLSNWKIICQKLKSKTENSNEIIWLEDDSDDEREKFVAKEKSSIEQTIKQKLSQLDLKKQTDVIELNSDVEEGEIFDLTTQYPPCIRAILIKSTDYDDEFLCNNKLGTLFLVPYTGGSIGKNSNKHVIDLINEEDVDNLHAMIEYDLKKKLYYIIDKGSKGGSFINKEKLIQDEKYIINHGDKLALGKSVTLLIHIHNGSTTCINCEPGEMMQKFKFEKESKEKQNKMDVEESRREINKSIKKKYGIKWDNIDCEKERDYNDRSKIRRIKVGVDTSHILKEGEPSPASVHKPIDKNNLGLKLLKNMGWKEGTGLGKDGSGIKEPVTTVIRKTSAGLGFGQSVLSLDANEKDKRKLINWSKTNNRFNLIDKKSQKDLSNVFNIDDDDDEDN